MTDSQGKSIDTVDSLNKGDMISVRFSDGMAHAEVTDTERTGK